jgi:hypothetical protein
MTAVADRSTAAVRWPSWALVTLAGLVVAMTTGPQGPLGGFWGAPSGEELGITGGLMGGFVAYGLIEAAAFGLGIAWFVFGRRLLTAGGLGTAAWLSVGWTLVSWFPHGGFHQAIDHHDMGGLLAIEFGFHATMIVAATVIALYLARLSARGAES